MTKQGLIELVAVGHVTIDRVEGEERLGGAATYAALTARHLGVRAAVVTSAAPDFPFWDRFTGIEISSSDADHTTTLEHDFAGGRREQTVVHIARSIRQDDFAGLRVVDDAAVLYCPVLHEIEVPLEPVAGNGITAVAPQGWFRQWDETGRISPREWDDAASALAHADLVSMSEEDASVPEELADNFAGTAFAITKGRAGCRVYSGVDIFDFPAIPTSEVDATGAGDVFATAFVIAVRRGDSVAHAARFATREAAAAVGFVGTEGFR